jgi:predicted DNA-binding transcriptional regulator AlpA
MSPKRTVGDRFKGSAAPPDYYANPPEATLPFEKPWDRVIVAEYLGMTISGLDKLIKDRRAPPYFKAGRMLRWRPSVVRAWTMAQEEAAATVGVGVDRIGTQ